MRIVMLLALLAAVPLPADAQMPQSGPAAARPSASPSAVPAPVPEIPPPTVQGGATGAVPEQVAPPGSGGSAGPANNTPFSGPPATGLSRGGNSGQTGAGSPLSR